MKYLDKIYKGSEISWFTPAEIFKVLSLSLSLPPLSAFWHKENSNSNLQGEIIVEKVSFMFSQKKKITSCLKIISFLAISKN